MYTLQEVFAQAMASSNIDITEVPNGYSVIHQGMKIQMFTDRIEILDMNRGGDYYKVIEDQHYEVFYEYGWEVACLHMVIINCLHKLELVEQKIKSEVNTRKNDRHIHKLKNKRESLMTKSTSDRKKLNSLTLIKSDD